MCEEITFIRTYHGKHGWSKISLQSGELILEWGTKRKELYKSIGPISPGRLEVEAIIASSDSSIKKPVKKWILRCISELDNLQENGKRVFKFVTDYDYGEGPIKMNICIESYQSIHSSRVWREFGEDWTGVNGGIYRVLRGSVSYRYQFPTHYLLREIREERVKYLCDEGKRKYIKEMWTNVFGKSSRSLPKVYKKLGIS